MARITFRLEWPSGTIKYVHNESEARKAFNEWMDPETDQYFLPITLHKVWLTPDAFERAYNGGGGHEEKEQLLRERKPTEPAGLREED